MSLRTDQETFAKNFALLILNAFTVRGRTVTIGECWRSPETAGLYAKTGRGITNSLHEKRLAADINLFQDGIYLTHSADYEDMGAYWKSLDSRNRWGGDFHDSSGRLHPDGNHFEMRPGT